MSSHIAFVFPGQGSQQVGMLADLHDQEPVVRDTFSEASDALGIDLSGLILQGPAEQLNSTEITQPALLTCSVALWRLWQQRSELRPGYMAGHSLGEYSALVCAGSMGFADAIRVVNLRGQLMQKAVPAGEGAMAAILGLTDDDVRAACEQAANGDIVSAVNYNSPGQVVIAGSSAAVERAISNCKEAGAKRALPLPVSVPSHCALMKPAAEQLAETLNQIPLVSPQIPVVQNVAARVASSPEQVRESLLQQLYSPVLWVDSMQMLANNGVTLLLECGPGKVLSGLAKRIDRNLNAVSMESADAFKKALETASL
ncbi:ACP S-malonyltransferase [Aestuariirhabdus litorea]|uniref:Malonyl CoA-acyl carrier protein transacylase n=1 Tax=Aestuariirhabdus litorea TaxID=2528527 RepID=A0A3P3VPL1_9GAMM|nr:ACP S-malonyltransferase [Aestuariirhabdus litorea]RRJ84702.1 [acyl-carrier-protein] S-malonyltransferase [Aestuariirhabdus litorea]RWW97927.1 [acyl-carrier-protein] S-malonyltransferase [Endozoicomonadaceae bacterium GTF-13]